MCMLCSFVHFWISYKCIKIGNNYEESILVARELDIRIILFYIS